jgi:mannose/fructose/N-acetylgalactosamine-specific phosphotransferase system component IIC
MEIVELSLLGGLLALDATSVGQFMVSRPLVAGGLVGWLLHEPELGFLIGAVLELYLLVSFPTGGSRFPEGATATVVAAASAAGAGDPGAVPLAVAIGLVWGQLGGASITLLRRVNSKLIPEPGDSAARVHHIVAFHLTAILLDFMRGAIVTLSGALVGRALVRAAAGSWMLSPASSLGLLLVGGAVSAGILLRDLGGVRGRTVLFLAGVALGLLGVRFL